MQKLFKLKKLWLVRPFICVFSIGGGVIAYQTYCLKKRFSSLVSPSINEQPEYTNSYISLSHQNAEVEINSFLTRLLSIENLISTILKGPKFVANDTNPWHLLRILKSNPHSAAHNQALKTLACSTYSDGLSREVAQACDFQTAVKLARIPDVNLNLFLPPPSYLTAFCGCVEDELAKILSLIKPSKEYVCAQYFLDAANQLIETQKNEQFILSWDEQIVQLPRPVKTTEVTELYLRALLHQSCSFENSKIMIKNGLLPTLWQVLESFPQETTLKTLAVEIIANISQFVQHHVHIFQSGWIRLFAELLVSDNVRLSLSAGKALANMEESVMKHGIYDSSVYILHPLQEADDFDSISKKASYQRTINMAGCSTGPWDVDVIFVHGLLGGVSYTWRQSEMGRSNQDYTYCWPKDWLPKDVPGLRILGIDYTTSLSNWKNRCPEDSPRRTIDARSDELLNSLQRAGVGNRPIVWVAHSMGGLLVKQLLIKASKSKDSNISAVVKNSKAVLMLSVPHGGSPVATLNPPARFLFLPSVEVEELRKGLATI